eukprot:10916883-Alexandrium_andersonii.AAC.1
MHKAVWDVRPWAFSFARARHGSSDQHSDKLGGSKDLGQLGGDSGKKHSLQSGGPTSSKAKHTRPRTQA